MTTAKLELKRVVPAPAEQVFEAWTKPAVMGRWLAPGPMTCDAQADVRVGGSYRLAMTQPDGTQHVVSGTYREIVPNQKLTFTWSWSEDPHVSQVTVSLRALGGETELTLLHEQLASEESKARHDEGWVGCLDKLRKLWT